MEIIKLTPLKAIRLKCKQCKDNVKKVKDCIEYECALWRYRFGKDPGRIGCGRPGGNPSIIRR